MGDFHQEQLAGEPWKMQGSPSLHFIAPRMQFQGFTEQWQRCWHSPPESPPSSPAHMGHLVEEALPRLLALYPPGGNVKKPEQRLEQG